MSARHFLHLAFCVSLLHSAETSETKGKGTSASALIISHPQKLQVIQRNEKNEGTLFLAGTVNESVTELRYRLGGQPPHGELKDAWQNVLIDANHNFKSEITLPAGGWYRLEVKAFADGQVLAQENVDQIGVGEVFIIAGQSNAGNYGSEKQETKTRMVSSFDGRDWSLANDPQRGAGGNGGSFMPAFGDALSATLHVPVGIVPVAAGGTSVREWLPAGIRFKQNTTTGGGVKKVGAEFESNGVLFGRLCDKMQALGKNGFRAVLWHQGESDAGQAREGHPADRQISGAQYADFMARLIKDCRERAGWNVPWLTAITTYHNENQAGDDEFRDAMKSLWTKGLSFQGPDTDSLRGDLRAGVHFNARGLQKHGELWAEKVLAWMAK